MLINRNLGVFFGFLLFFMLLMVNAEAATPDVCKRGKIATENNQHLAAINLLTECIILPELEPSVLAMAFQYRGTSYRRQGNLNKAILDLDQAVELAPNDPKVWISRGVILVSQGNNSAAINDFTQALRIQPTNGMALVNRAGLLEIAGDVGGAKRDYQTALNAGMRHPHVIKKANEYGLKISGSVKKGGAQLSIEIPGRFKQVHAEQNNMSKIFQYVPKSQNLQNWSEMITLTMARLTVSGERTGNVIHNQILEGYRQVCGKAKRENYRFRETDFTKPRESEQAPGHFAVTSDFVWSGMVFCDAVDKSKIPSHIHSKKNSFIFVKSLGLPSGFFTVQYEWQDEKKAAREATHSTAFKQEIMLMMNNATAYVQ